LAASRILATRCWGFKSNSQRMRANLDLSIGLIMFGMR
jgi:hypothetical protein